MEVFEKNNIVSLTNPGVVSRQLIWPTGSPNARATITEVHVEPHAVQPRHIHEHSEQIWYALKGTGTLLVGNDSEIAFRAGDVARFAEGDVHGLRNGDGEFIYLSVTTPPINFERAYQAQM